ncbi:MAG: hypothetical protein K0Q79_3348 [Flavipsychrobacter sp.]|nr:hypothetical protein [Flavipsychrobacter sp.]
MTTAIKTDSLMTGMFRTKEDADNAYTALQLRGYGSNEIYLLMSQGTHDTHFHNGIHEKSIGNKAMEGAGTGGAIGVTVGAIAAAIAVIGTSIVIPGLGLVIAGPLVAAAAGAGAGGVAGGIIGALVGAGIPKERAIIYEKGISEGNIVIGVRPRNQADAEFIENEWIKNHVVEIHH